MLLTDLSAELFQYLSDAVATVLRQLEIGERHGQANYLEYSSPDDGDDANPPVYNATSCPLGVAVSALDVHNLNGVQDTQMYVQLGHPP
jgi:hypothetical protein